MRQRQDLNKKGLASIKVPFLVLHGEGDQLCNPKGSALLYEQASVEDKTLKIMPSALHNLYHELPEIREESLTDTVTWIMERIPETIYIDDWFYIYVLFYIRRSRNNRNLVHFDYRPMLNYAHFNHMTTLDVLNNQLLYNI